MRLHQRLLQLASVLVGLQTIKWEFFWLAEISLIGMEYVILYEVATLLEGAIREDVGRRELQTCIE